MKHLLHYPGFRFVIIVDESGVGGRVGMVRVLRLFVYYHWPFVVRFLTEIHGRRSALEIYPSPLFLLLSTLGHKLGSVLLC